jgi:hypothetical protein
VAKLKPELFFSSIFAKNKKPHYRSGVLVFGTSGRTRTGTLLRARDFESRVSTNSTTLAFHCSVDGQGDKPLPLQSQQAGDYSSDDVWVN